MSEPPKETTNWSMWEDLKGKIDSNSNRNKAVIPLWAWLPIALGLCLYFGYSLGSKNDNADLSNSFQDIDTVYVKQNVYLIDTIFQNRYITKYLEHKISQEENQILENQQSALVNAALKNEIEYLKEKLNQYSYAIQNGPYKNDPYFSTLILHDSGTNQLGSDAANINNENIGLGQLNRSNEIVNFDLLNNLQLYVSSENLIRKWNLSPTVLVKKKKSFLSKLTPDYYNLGLSVKAPTFAFVKNFNTGFEFGSNLNLEMLFSPRFSIESGIGLTNSTISIWDYETAKLYAVADYTEGDEFKKLSLSLSSLIIPISGKYKLYSDRNWKPYFRFGAQFNSILSEEFQYEFSRGLDEVYVEIHGKRSSLQLNSLIGGFGFERKLFHRINGYVEPFGRYAFNFNNNSNRLHGLGLNLGLYYEL